MCASGEARLFDELVFVEQRLGARCDFDGNLSIEHPSLMLFVLLVSEDFV